MTAALFSGIKRNILILGFVSLLTDLSSQIIFPLLPLYLTTVLGAGAQSVGIIEGAAESTAAFLKVFSGYWSDKIKKRKVFILAGYGLSSISKPLFALAATWPFVLFARIVERIGKGIRTAPRDALIASSCEPPNKGIAFGIQRAMDGIGSTVGAILAYAFLPILGFKNLFLLATIPAFLAVAAVLFVSEPKANMDAPALTLKVSFKSLPKNLKIFIVASSIFAFGHFGYAFLLLRAKQLDFSNQTAIFFYILFYLIYSLSSPIAGKISDRLGRKPMLMAGYFLFSVISLVLLTASSYAEMIFTFCLYGVFFALIDGIQRAYVTDLCPEALKATALGTFHTAIGLAALPGGFLSGLLWEVFSPEATFLFGFIFSLIATLTILSIPKYTITPDYE